MKLKFTIHLKFIFIKLSEFGYHKMLVHRYQNRDMKRQRTNNYPSGLRFIPPSGLQDHI